MVYNLIRKKLREKRFPVSFPKFLKRPILQNISDRMLEWNEPKKLCLIFLQENTNENVHFSADMWAS